jgi:MYXO-CTERM domain-containing protein
MARGELMKRLLASYGREDEFRSVAEEIIREEEQKNNRADSNVGCSCQVVHPRTARPLGLVGLLALWGVNVWRRRAA